MWGNNTQKTSFLIGMEGLVFDQFDLFGHFMHVYPGLVRLNANGVWNILLRERERERELTQTNFRPIENLLLINR